MEYDLTAFAEGKYTKGKKRTYNEEFVTIESFPEYEVNRLGIIKRKIPKNGKETLTPFLDRKKQTYVNLRKNKKQYRINVAKLVYEIFVGEVPAGLVVRHADNDPTNNRLGNLVLRKNCITSWWDGKNKMRKL